MTTAVSLAQIGSNNTTFRNRIINGAMMIDQRYAGASYTQGATTTYGVDRFFTQASVGSKFSAQQSSVAPAGFINSWLLTSLAATSVGSTDYYQFGQNIEGLNIADLGWGTSSAQAVTLSFWVRSSVTGTYGGSLRNSAGNRCYPFTYTISSSNTWEQKTITIAGDTTGTWLTTNGVGINLNFGLGNGSSNKGTAGAWSAAGYQSATGAIDWVGTSGATFYITGVQLEKGTVATPFEYRQYGTELALCQRYLQMFASSASGATPYAPVFCFSSTGAVGQVTLTSVMRALPTLTWSNLRLWNTSGNEVTVTGLSISTSSTPNYVYLTITVASGLSAGAASFLHSGTTLGTMQLSAEL